eukprot:4586113-Prymnesium_polylepis.1
MWHNGDHAVRDALVFSQIHLHLERLPPRLKAVASGLKESGVQCQWRVDPLFLRRERREVGEVGAALDERRGIESHQRRRARRTVRERHRERRGAAERSAFCAALVEEALLDHDVLDAAPQVHVILALWREHIRRGLGLDFAAGRTR